MLFAIELGNVDQHLSFDKPVRIEFPGVGGEHQLAVFTKDPGSSEVYIYHKLSVFSDSQDVVQNQLAPGEKCFIQNGPNLVIWTTEFSGFGCSKTSTSSSTKGGPGGPAGAGSAGGGGGGGGGGGSVSLTPSTPSTPTPGIGFPGTLGPITTGFGNAKFTDLLIQFDDGSKI